MSSSLQRALAACFSSGRGRPAALLILLLLTLLNLYSNRSGSGSGSGGGSGSAADTWYEAPFQIARQSLFDAYQQEQPRTPQSHPVTIVAIDEASLKQLGQWPWPRHRLAALVSAITAQQPAAIGLDIYLPEADQTSPAQMADQLPASQATLASALRQLPDHDEVLATALRQAPTVLGAAGFDFRTLTSSAGLRTYPLAVRGGHDPLPHLRQYPWVLASLPVLQAAASGQAVLSMDSDNGVIRRVPLVMAVNGQLVPGLGLEMLRVATDSPISVVADAGGVRQVGVADLLVPTQSNGEMWLHFARFAAGQARYLSAAAVLAGQADAELLTGKLVMIGVTGVGLADQRFTALGEQVPGIEIQAQVVEALFDGHLLLRPDWLYGLETLLILVIGGLLIFFVPRASSLPADVLPAPPRRSLLLTAAALLVLLGAGFLLFRQAGLLFDAAAPVLVLAPLMASLMASALIEIDRRGAALARTQQRLREEAAKAAGELSAAGRIQLGSLPQAAALFAGETRFELVTLLEPAKDVGGDLYDFFMIDERHLGFVIGDVSGKGLPASLFMAVTKTLAKTLAKHVAAGPQRVAELVNTELAEVNPEALFVTALIGVLDIDSGLLTLVNAGHDAPWLIQRDGQMQPLTSPPDAGGPPLCMIDDFPYGAQQAQLTPGDTLVMYTDGITEAMSPAAEIYGGARLEAILAGANSGSLHDLLHAVRADVAHHVAGAEASDDLTLLLIRWTPPLDPAVGQ